MYNKSKEINVVWGQNNQNQWCSLYNTDFSVLSSKSGVYIIWEHVHPNRYRIIKVGQSIDLSQRFISYKNDKQVLFYNNGNNLYVTWAELSPSYLDGVESYLGRNLCPLISYRFPDAFPIFVNRPF